jgi:5-(carboxyamino)imidazole ribonucleotide synthase
MMQQNKTIGIVGGGQLARMLIVAAKKLGFSVIVSDPTPQSPAGQIADKQIVGGYKDAQTIKQLADMSDIVTIDAEFVNTDALAEIEAAGKPVHPKPQTIAMIKDKLQQKEFLREHDLPTAEFTKVGPSIRSDLEKAGENFGYPFLLKARTDAYDGKGNFVVRSKDDIITGMEALQNRALYVERFVPFIKEIAIMVARSTTGEIQAYPVVETKHKDNICDTVLVPARISESVQKAATDIATKTMRFLGGAGVFGVEMFLEKDDTIRINEIAPRVHNSGHFSIESCVTSQFEQHIRAISGLDLGETTLTVQAAVMKNILGTRTGTGEATGIEEAEKIPNVHVHMYGKKESREKRKMGHITVTGQTVEECLEKAERARRMISI